MDAGHDNAGLKDSDARHEMLAKRIRAKRILDRRMQDMTMQDMTMQDMTMLDRRLDSRILDKRMLDRKMQEKRMRNSRMLDSRMLDKRMLDRMIPVLDRMVQDLRGGGRGLDIAGQYNYVCPNVVAGRSLKTAWLLYCTVLLCNKIFLMLINCLGNFCCHCWW